MLGGIINFLIVFVVKINNVFVSVENGINILWFELINCFEICGISNFIKVIIFVIVVDIVVKSIVMVEIIRWIFVICKFKFFVVLFCSDNKLY